MEITATIIVKMNEPIDQPLMDWLIDAIQEQLEDGEELLSYVDTQAGDAFPVNVNDKTH